MNSLLSKTVNHMATVTVYMRHAALLVWSSYCPTKTLKLAGWIKYMTLNMRQLQHQRLWFCLDRSIGQCTAVPTEIFPCRTAPRWGQNSGQMIIWTAKLWDSKLSIIWNWCQYMLVGLVTVLNHKKINRLWFLFQLSLLQLYYWSKKRNLNTLRNIIVSRLRSYILIKKSIPHFPHA